MITSAYGILPASRTTHEYETFAHAVPVANRCSGREDNETVLVCVPLSVCTLLYRLQLNI